jgi:hypothetical protein
MKGENEKEIEREREEKGGEIPAEILIVFLKVSAS